MMFLYNTILFLLAVPAALVLLVRYRKRGNRGGLTGLGERLGRWQVPASVGAGGRPVLWVHGASLGEMRAVEPLIAELAEYDIVITTLTETGYDYARARGLGKAVFLAPLDFSGIVRGVMKKVRPAGLILIETELWPSLIRVAKDSGCRVIIINARLSQSSFGWYCAVRSFWRYVLGSVDRCAARAPEDAERFALLGMPRERITVTGNIKYDRDFSARGITKQSAGFADTDLVWIAGSTRSGEEAIVAAVFAQLRERFPRLKLIIAPRHVNRAPEIARQLADREISVSLRSSPAAAPGDCLLIDTFGELPQFYALADVAFVGGSLVPRGGQNPIEPAAGAKPVLFGPYMDNFTSESRMLRENGGACAVRDGADLRVTLEKLLSDPVCRRTMGERARQAVEQQKGALARSAAIIRSLMPGTGR